MLLLVILTNCICAILTEQNITNKFNITEYNGKTYYFRYNSTTNQYQIYNRVFFDGNIRNPATAHQHTYRTSDLRKLEAYLDNEWNFSSTRAAEKERLPVQIYKVLYEEVVDENKDTLNYVPATRRILFDKNNNDTSPILHFDFNYFKREPILDTAELHFYWEVDRTSEFYKNSAVLRLYQIERKKHRNMDNSKLLENPDVHSLLNVIYISKAQTNWQVFKLKKLLENVEDESDELELLISISKSNELNFTSIFNDANQDEKFRTFIVLKSKTLENSSTDVSNDEFDSGLNVGCNRRELYIDFKKLNWHNFIIMPSGYKAYDCYGRCFRNTQHTSNHIKMVNTFQEVDRQTRTPCCSPTQYDSLPIMFYDKNGNIVIKTYKDMIVAQCGCR